MELREGDPKLQGYDAVFFIAGISHDIPLHFADVIGPEGEDYIRISEWSR